MAARRRDVDGGEFGTTRLRLRKSRLARVRPLHDELLELDRQADLQRTERSNIPTKVGCRSSQLSPDVGMRTVAVVDYIADVAHYQGDRMGCPA